MSKIVTWRGKAIEEYSKEELVGIVREMAEIIESDRKSHQQTLGTWKLCRNARRVG